MLKLNSRTKTGAGFTLIELLVVIAIIGLLASVVLVALNGARVKARDTRRKADLKQLNTALNLYYNDNNQYPNCGGWTYSTDATWNTTGCLITALKPYISKLPVDPTNNIQAPWGTGNYSYAYGVSPSFQDYDLVAQLENTSDTSICQFKQWIYHYYTTLGGGGSTTASWCSGTYGYSNYMYADH